MKVSIYTSLDLQAHAFPSRSYLYQLEPHGYKTTLVESLSSYITRLAEAHCVSPRLLMSKVIVPAISKNYRSTNLFSMRNSTGAINGTGTMASDLINILEQLTLQSNLQALTLLPFSNIFPQRKLTRHIKAWCPECYRQQRENKQPIYDPLLWSLDIVKVCPYHNLYLSTKCPDCGRELPILGFQSRVGYCMYCKCWLGRRSFPLNSYDESELSNWNAWVATTLGEFLGAYQIRALRFEREFISHSLSHYIAQVADGNLSIFARTLKIPKNTMWMWREGEAIPQIDVLLKICYCLELSLLDFFSCRKSSELSRVSVLSARLSLYGRSNRQGKANSLNLNAMEAILDGVLHESNEAPLPMTEVARLIGHNKRVIHRHFPERCRAISAKYLAYKRRERLQKIREACRRVQQAVQQLHEMGIYPTENGVAKYLELPGIFRDKEVREAFYQARSSLGL